MREERRRGGGVDYAGTCRHVLSCSMNNYVYIYIYILFEGCDIPQWFHVFAQKE